MTVYCQRCDAEFDALLGGDISKEREMYLEHLRNFHNDPDPTLHSFFMWEIDQGVDTAWGHRRGKAGYELK